MSKDQEENKQSNEGLTLKEFEALSSFIYTEIGIKMPPNKKIMLEARLKKRLKELDVISYSDYTKMVLSRKSPSEIFHFIDVVTTNKTDFFREPKQFGFLTEQAMPELRRLFGIGQENPLRVWSAGCSSGEEPYTLAMVLSEETGQLNQVRIFASDVSTEVLKKAQLAVYEEERVEPVPMEFKRRYLLKSR
ncbi:MAG: CheR family methyltransferase, partial [Acidobacteriota bacterium]